MWVVVDGHLVIIMGWPRVKSRSLSFCTAHRWMREMSIEPRYAVSRKKLLRVFHFLVTRDCQVMRVSSEALLQS